jgi:hypothetical protein
MPKRKQQQPKQPLYMVYVYRVHPSGIGHTFVRYEETPVKPTFDNGHWQDLTNGVWARTVK